jgi:ABC-type antimicrobial peptide transport system permease subunit
LKNLVGTGSDMGVYYLPAMQSPPRNFTFAVRLSADPGNKIQALRAAMASVDPSLALFDVRTMEERAALSLGSRRAALTLAMGFGAVSLFLSSIGIYGVLSYLVAQRRREIGIRIAVGSGPAGIFRLFLRSGVALAGTGLALGLVATFALRGVVEKFLYGVKAHDTGVLLCVAALLGAIAIFAMVWPAYRAARVDPIAALQE